MKYPIFSVINLLFILLSCNQINESICLIPKNYTGTIIIIFDQKEGVPPEIEKRKHVYKIPPSGVLKTQVKANYNVQGHEYYYLDSMGNRIPIPYLLPKEFSDVDTVKIHNKVYCYNEEMGSTAQNKPGYKQYRMFFVGKPNQMDSLSNIKTGILFKALAQ